MRIDLKVNGKKDMSRKKISKNDIGLFNSVTLILLIIVLVVIIYLIVSGFKLSDICNFYLIIPVSVSLFTHVFIKTRWWDI